MRIFVSYARRDRQAVDALLQDIRRARHDVWVDEELTGGQSWWDTILGTIRGADLFVVALSPDWLTSKACAAELNYAVACNRTVLPIMVHRVSPQMAPQVIADSQIVDYLERTPDTAIGLMTALSTVRPSGQLPEPRPPHPPVPMSYMSTYRERVDELNLSFQQQSQLLSELRAHLTDDDDRDSAVELIKRLRRRGDITESVGREIDALLGSSLLTTPTRTEETAATRTTPAGWYADPQRRYEQRYWDGSTWTQHVSSGGRQLVDAAQATPTPTVSTTSMQQPVATRPDTPVTSTAGKWDTGTYVCLLVASALIGLVGIIVGAINMKKPARRAQAAILLILGIASVLFFLGRANFNSGSDFGLGRQVSTWLN